VLVFAVAQRGHQFYMASLGINFEKYKSQGGGVFY